MIDYPAPQQMMREMRSRSIALRAWLDSQEIPIMERAPLLAWTAGVYLAQKKPAKEMQNLGLALLDMFMVEGVSAFERNDV